MQHLFQRLEKGGVLSCAGIAPAAQPFFAALLRHLFPARSILVVTEGLKTQEQFHQDLITLSGFESPPELGPAFPVDAPIKPLFFPAWESLPHEATLPHADVISDRLETLIALSDKASRGQTVVTNIVALLQRTFPLEELRRRTRTLHRGEKQDPLDLVEWLEDQGYEPEAKVTAKGEIALRGGILDIFPLTSPWPVRMEFFGDELESLRYFDPITQISREEITSVIIPPGGELGLLKRWLSTSANLSGERPAGASVSPPRLATVVEYLEPGAILLLCQPADPQPSTERGCVLGTTRGHLIQEQAEEYARQCPETDPFSVSWEQLRNQAETEFTLVEVCEDIPEALGTADIPEYGGNETETSPAPNGSATSSPEDSPGTSDPDVLRLDSLEAFRPLALRPPEPQVAEAQRRDFFVQLHRWLRQGYSVHVFCNNQGERDRFAEIWEDYGLAEGAGEPAVTPTLHLGTLARGFLCEQAKLVVVTDAEIFGRYRVQRPRRLKSPHAQATRSALDIDFTELEEGDYVVHLQHGIGRYLGLAVLPIGAGTKPTEHAQSTSPGQECLVLEYAPTDPAQPPPKLYVPVTEAHLVSKYVGTGKARPPLNTLGGTRWSKAKAQAERAVRDVASELLSIQAARDSQPGHSFQPDTAWQREFESAFIFEETPDQLRAIRETKLDMERPKPMDRLICGDVGFGKTEVGIRAGFKAVMDGRQVAVLVPTTVLAQQHFNTFRERMADYPIRVELLSRFRTKREQQKVVKDLVAGAVDIVIGTHRLLQGDIAFKDLGLVVIDEEQRFGVLHKEKFKMLRKLVDVLTLSATPIPRTLYLALSGARDMSTIQTPPHDRLPVETVVTQYDERIIRDAIRREISRGGQVFFLHNRVATIHTMAQKLRTLLPQARLVIGHGQMHSDDLEEVMTAFVNGEADVLLSTTIIESGLDIPNANTIIIDRADRFGLSDLYQLRGRVGRYKHQAYAYLLLPRHARLLTDVRKRMSAIKQYSTLGSGFKIAMRDLEIRGAGNLLGSEQSGHITAVGFELYCQLLKQSVAALKGEKIKPRVEVQVRLDFLSLNPTELPSVTDAGDSGPETLPDSPGSLQAPRSVAQERFSTESATVPYKYISDARQRIEVYRKLAQATERQGIQDLEKEFRDRFGPLPRPVSLLLMVAELKVLAAEKGITAVEVKENRLMLTRQGDFVMVGSKFPRLTKKTAEAKLKEIKRLLLVL